MSHPSMWNRSDPRSGFKNEANTYTEQGTALEGWPVLLGQANDM